MEDESETDHLHKGSDSESDSDSSERSSDSSSAKEKKKKDKKKKSKKKKKKKDKEKEKKGKKATTDESGHASPVGAGPRTPKAQKGFVLKSSPVESPSTPRNLDGSLWKNPLNRWSNKPVESNIKETGTQIWVTIPSKTNVWRKSIPHANLIIDSAPYYWHKVSGDFEVMVKLSGEFSSNYDKAGLMVRLDEENWVTSGLEMCNERINHSTCVTRDFSDRSLAPLPENAEKNGVWICVKRMGHSFESFYSHDAKKWVQTRQALFTERPVLQVGLMGACPTGSAFKVVFDQYRVRTI